MNVYSLNQSLEVIGIIDDFNSLTWAERHYEAGDFELEVPIFYSDSELLTIGNFLALEESEVLMIIETTKPSREENSSSLVVTGRSAESLLDRRWLLELADLSGHAELTMYTLVDENVVNPTNPKRAISLLAGTNIWDFYTDEYVSQVEPASIYDICMQIAKMCDLGFKVVMLPSDPRLLSFIVYKGIDYSARQSLNARVVFSAQFDNLISSSYYRSQKERITVVRVLVPDDPVYASSDVWTDSIYWGPTAIEPEDLERYESVIESPIDRFIVAGDGLSDAVVEEMVYNKGMEIIQPTFTKGLIEGEFDINGTFKYGEHFNMGDIVHVRIDGYETPARVVELVRSYSVSGNTAYLTFDYIDVRPIS